MAIWIFQILLSLSLLIPVSSDTPGDDTTNNIFEKRMQQLENKIFIEISMRQITVNELRQRLDDHLMENKQPELIIASEFTDLKLRMTNLEHKVDGLTQKCNRHDDNYLSLIKTVSHLRTYLHEEKMVHKLLKSSLEDITQSEEARATNYTNVVSALDIESTKLSALSKNISADFQNMSSNMVALASHIEERQEQLLQSSVKKITESEEGRTKNYSDVVNALGNETIKFNVLSKTLSTGFQNISSNVVNLTYRIDGIQEKFTDVVSILENANLIPTHRDCTVWYKIGKYSDGIYKVKPHPLSDSFNVYCDMTNGGRTVLQRRHDNSVNFTRPWKDYIEGFGKLEGNFWLGLEKIHLLTGSASTVIIVAVNVTRKTFVQHMKFSVDGEDTDYTMHASGNWMEINIGNFRNFDGRKFVALDTYQKHKHCKIRHIGWWYNKCIWYSSMFNINGPSNSFWDPYNFSTKMSLKSQGLI